MRPLEVLLIGVSVDLTVMEIRFFFLVWFVLRQINHCRLYNAKSYLYIYIKYMISKLILLLVF